MTSKNSRTSSLLERTSSPVDSKSSLMLSSMVTINLLCDLFCRIENLTKEQYSGNFRSKLPMLNSSRDALNPSVNLETLRNRLWVTEYYRTLHGVEQAYWPHYVLRNVGGHLNKYKFNYLVKGFFIYQAYRQMKNYQHLNSVSFLSSHQQFGHLVSIGWATGVAGAVCLLIWEWVHMASIWADRKWFLIRRKPSII